MSTKCCWSIRVFSQLGSFAGLSDNIFLDDTDHLPNTYVGQAHGSSGSCNFDHFDDNDRDNRREFLAKSDRSFYSLA